MKQTKTAGPDVQAFSASPRKSKYRRLAHRILCRFRKIPEFILFAIASAIIPFTSRKISLAIGDSLGAFCFWTMKKRRTVAFANLDIVYGNRKTKEEKTRIIKSAMNNFGHLITDYFWFSRNTGRRLKRHKFTCDNATEKWIQNKEGGIIVTLHLGNWELAAHYLASRGCRLCSVYRPVGSSYVSKTLVKFRSTTGADVVPRKGALINIVRALKQKKFVVFLLDQHTDVTESGTYVDFFGLPATFSTAAVFLAARMKAPIYVAAVPYYPSKDSSAIVTPKVFSVEECSGGDHQKILAGIISAMEKIILEYPEQWLWTYKRWKRYTKYHDASKFPYYASFDENIV